MASKHENQDLYRCSSCSKELPKSDLREHLDEKLTKSNFDDLNIRCSEDGCKFNVMLPCIEKMMNHWCETGHQQKYEVDWTAVQKTAEERIDEIFTLLKSSKKLETSGISTVDQKSSPMRGRRRKSRQNSKSPKARRMKITKSKSVESDCDSDGARDRNNENTCLESQGRDNELRNVFSSDPFYVEVQNGERISCIPAVTNVIVKNITRRNRSLTTERRPEKKSLSPASCVSARKSITKRRNSTGLRSASRTSSASSTMDRSTAGDAMATCKLCTHKANITLTFKILRHALRHSDVHLFECGICGHKTKNRRRAISHIKEHHGKAESDNKVNIVEIVTDEVKKKVWQDVSKAFPDYEWDGIYENIDFNY